MRPLCSVKGGGDICSYSAEGGHSLSRAHDHVSSGSHGLPSGDADGADRTSLLQVRDASTDHGDGFDLRLQNI